MWLRVRHEFKEQQISEFDEQVKMKFRVNYVADKNKSKLYSESDTTNTSGNTMPNKP